MPEPPTCRWPEPLDAVLREPAARVLQRAWPALQPWLAQQAFGDTLREALEPLYVPLAGWLATRRQRQGTPLIAAIAGAQGSGKSSLAALLQPLLREGLGLRATALSLDDLYLTRAQRARLAREVHPLLATRGLPGTHDVALGLRVLDALRDAAPGERVRVPRFDKARDERVEQARWPVWRGPTDLVLFEGWCLGAEPEPEAALQQPLNAFEREQDVDGRFRRHVNAQLASSYRPLFARLDALIFLAVPDMACVRRWRGRQEQQLAARAPDAPGLMDAQQLESFVQSFERISLRMLEQTPAHAQIVLRLNHAHHFGALELHG